MTTYFLSAAQSCVHKSIEDVEGGHYLKSWARMVPARLSFLADAVVHAAILPFMLIAFIFAACEMVFTWGQRSAAFWEGVSSLDDTVNRLFASLLGALVSTQWGDQLHREHAKPFEWILGAIALASPNLVFYSPKNGWGFGWSV